MHENGPKPRCPECNHKAPAHAEFCRAGIDESKPMTSAERYATWVLPTHEEEQHRAAHGPFGKRAQAWEAPSGCGDVCGPAAPLMVGSLAPDPFAPEQAEFGRGPIMDTLAAVETYNEEKRQEHLKPGHVTPTGQEQTVQDPILAARMRGPIPVEEAIALSNAGAGLNPKDLVGSSKTPLGLLPWSALVQVAGVFAVGAKKYGSYNWRTKGQPVQHVTYVEAAFRHLAAYMDGQTIDPETGCNHLAHAACGLLILLDASAVGNSIDNRPTPGNAAEIMALPK